MKLDLRGQEKALCKKKQIAYVFLSDKNGLRKKNCKSFHNKNRKLDWFNRTVKTSR